MKKVRITLLIVLILLMGCTFVACSNGDAQQSSNIPSGQTPSQQGEDGHEHTFSSAWTYNDTHHWHDASCGHDVVSDFAPHTFGEWVIDTPATEETEGVKHRICTVCGKTEIGSIDRLPHEHRYSSAWTYNDTHHWHDASCGHDVVSDFAPHTFGEWVIDTPATEETEGVKHRICTICGKTETGSIDRLPHEHRYSSEWSSNDTHHWQECSCGEKQNYAQHTYGDWVIDTPATEETEGVKHRICTICGKTETGSIDRLPHEHRYSSEWSSNDTHHWQECSCGEKQNYAQHTYGDWVIDTPVTAEADGAKYRTCTVCGHVENAIIPQSEFDLGLAMELSGDETYYIVDGIGTCTATSLSIPSTYRGKPVTEIASYAFEDCTRLRRVTVPSSVTIIGSMAFKGCYRMSKFEVQGNATFGNQILCNCSGLEELVLYSTEQPIYKFFSELFEYNTNEYNVISVNKKDGYVSLGYTAELNSYTVNGNYYYYYKGKYYYYPASLRKIEVKSGNIPERFCSSGSAEGANLDNSPLTEVVLGAGVIAIGDNAFNNCRNIESIKYSGNLAEWCSISGLGNFTSSSRKLYINGEDLTGDLVIPDGVTTIQPSAFCGCSSLTSITIPGSVTSIGNSAFYNCTGLTSVTIGNSVTSIGNSAFRGCSGLTSVTIGNSVTSIGNSAFYNCTGLTAITIPDSVTSIGGFAFYNCTGLTSITISDGVTSIGDSVFSGCSGLTSVTIPDSVTSIRDSVFSGCSGLTSVTIPDSVTSIGNKTFSGCSSLVNMTIPFIGGSRKTSSDTYQHPFGYIFGSDSYTGGKAVEQEYYGSSPSGTTSTTYYYIPSSLRSVTVTGGNILYGAFSNCSMLTSITIGNGVTSIGEKAFSGCSGLTSVTIGNGVTSIGYQAFYGCSGLTSIYYTGDVARWCEISGIDSLMSSSRTLYINGAQLTGDLVIPNSVTTIQPSAFYGCSGLTSVTIGNGVTSIGMFAFYNCTGLTSVTIGNSVTSIGASAFNGCTGLTSVTISNSVTSIGDFAFSGCSRLTSITYNGTKAQWYAISKGNIWNQNTGKYTIHCTDGDIAKL